MVSIMFLLSCIKEHVTDITLNKNEIFLSPGGTETLIATIYPNDADNKNVKWKSSNPDVATVNDNGLVTAITDGKANITVTTKDGKKTVSCSVNVDYCGKWTGTYECEEINVWHIPFGNIYTEVYQTNVVITAKGDDLMEFCEKRNEKRYEARISRDGVFYEAEDISGKLIIKGNCNADSLNMTICHYLSPGSGSFSYYKGKKLK